MRKIEIKNKDIYKAYKPIRNYLRKVAVENVLYIIWAYVNHLQLDKKLPRDIEVHPSILEGGSTQPRCLFEWELAFLAKESILNSEDYFYLKQKNLNKWNYFAGALNKIKNFENSLWPLFDPKASIISEIRRIAHRQFPWQTRPNSSNFLRYYKIYSNWRIADMVRSRIGISVQQWYTLGTAILGAVLDYPKMNVDPKIVIVGLTKKEFDVFLSFVSCDIAELREIIKNETRYDDQYVYAFNPLEYYPLVKINEYYYCPMPTLLIWRITSGLYFDMIKDSLFGKPFGFAFQDYVQEISKKVLDPAKTSVIPEQKYIVKTQEDSVDIILRQQTSCFFVEVKAKRMQSRSKVQLVSSDAMDKDTDILSDNIVKVYETIKDYMGGYYSHFSYNPHVKVYPLVVTLEEWFIMGEDSANIKNKVRNKLKIKGFADNFLDAMPYSICSILNYEHLIQVLNNHSIEEVMSEWFIPEREGQNFGQYLISKFKEEYYPIDHYFPGDFEKIYPDGIMKKSH